MVAGHVAMLIVHKFVDGINLLPRMLPGKVFVGVNALIITLAVLLGFTFYKAEKATPESTDSPQAIVQSPAGADVDSNQSLIESESPLWQLVTTPDNFNFTSSYAGQPFVGAIREFTPKIFFDPTNPADGVIDVMINTQSITTNNKDWDRTIKGGQWFSTDAYPCSHYIISRNIHAEGGKFVANGELKLKGITKPITVTFN